MISPDSIELNSILVGNTIRFSDPHPPMFLSPRVSKPTYPATIIDRPRLYRQLDRWPELRAIVIHAPSGYGKSFLVSRWIDHAGLDGCAAWLSLDEGDGDPRQFAQHVAAALDRVVPGALGLAQPILKDSEGSTQRVLMRLFSALWEEAGTGSLTADRQTLLVLDDLHRVQSAEVDAAIRLILEQGPSQLHVLLLTRKRTTLPLARLYAHGKIAVLDAKEVTVRVLVAARFEQLDQVGDFLGHVASGGGRRGPDQTEATGHSWAGQRRATCYGLNGLPWQSSPSSPSGAR